MDGVRCASSESVGCRVHRSPSGGRASKRVRATGGLVRLLAEVRELENAETRESRTQPPRRFARLQARGHISELALKPL